MSLNSVNKNSTSSYIPNFNTVPAASATPQQPVEDKQKSNAYKYMLGATALAGLAALAIAGYKGHLGEGIQKFLGGAEKEAASIKPKASSTPNPESVMTPKAETVVNSTSESVVTPKAENIVSNTENEEIANNVARRLREELPKLREAEAVEGEVSSTIEKFAERIEEETGNIVERQISTTEEAGNIIRKEAEESGEAVSTGEAKVVRAAEIIPAKLEELVPQEMLKYSKITFEEIEKLPQYGATERIIESYPNGKPKYTINFTKNECRKLTMYDEESRLTRRLYGNCESGVYCEYSCGRETYEVSFKDGKIIDITRYNKWNDKGKLLEYTKYEFDNKTPKQLFEIVYDKDTGEELKTIYYKGPSKDSGIERIYNWLNNTYDVGL